MGLRCTVCGRPYYYNTYDSSAGICDCHVDKVNVPVEYEPKYESGWVCPLCNTVYAIWVKVCDLCSV